jgi:hypothetical protein
VNGVQCVSCDETKSKKSVKIQLYSDFGGKNAKEGLQAEEANNAPGHEETSPENVPFPSEPSLPTNFCKFDGSLATAVPPRRKRQNNAGAETSPIPATRVKGQAETKVLEQPLGFFSLLYPTRVLSYRSVRRYVLVCNGKHGHGGQLDHQR